MFLFARWTVAVLLTAGLAGCADDSLGPIEGTDCSNLPEPYYSPGYQPDMDLAEMIPGYAGTFLVSSDSDGRDFEPRAIQVNLTDPLQGVLHEDELRQYLAEWVGEPWSGELIFAQVAYSYLQLLDWKAFFFSAPGWNGLGIDILDNQVSITVADEDGAAEILRIAECRSIPQDAVGIEYGTSGYD